MSGPRPWRNMQNTVYHLTADQHQYCIQTVRHIAAYLNIEPDAITGPTRVSRVCLGRHLTCYVLSRHGLIPMQIARFINRDHSSVVHGIKRIQQCLATHPEVAAYLALLPDTPRRIVDATLAGALQHAIHRLPETARRCVLAYIYGDLLGWRIPPMESPTVRWQGHRLLTTLPELAAEVGVVLGYFHEDGAAGALAGQVRKLGRTSA